MKKLLLTSLFSILILLSAQQSHASVVQYSTSGDTLTQGLIGWWTFDGKDVVNGKIMDLSVSGNHGSPVNISTTTFYTAGKIGQGLKFDGVNDNVRIGDLTIMENIPSITVSAWVKSTNSGVTSGLVTKTSGGASGSWGLYLSSGNKFTFITIIDAVTTAHSVADSVYPEGWHHVVGIYNGSNVYLYVDGVLADATPGSLTGNIRDTSASVCFGAYNGSGGACTGAGTFANDTLDDVRVYNRALSVTEIKKLYNLGASGKINNSQNNTLTTNLTDIWSFDGKDLNSTTAFDRGVGAKNATLAGTPKPQIIPGKIGQALSFDGNNSYATLASNPVTTISAANSGCAWVYGRDPTLIGSGAWDQTIFNFYTDADNGIRIGNDSASGGGFYASYRSGGTFYGVQSSSIVFKQNTWTHVCYVWNGSAVTIYGNGLPLASSVNSNSIGEDNVIGARDASQNGLWYGYIDNINLYSRALSATDVEELYTAGGGKISVSLPGGDSLKQGLVGWWTFDGKDVVNGKVMDLSVSGNHGSPVNISTSTFYTAGKVGQGLQFDGVNDYVNMGDVAFVDGLTSFSTSFWFKRTTTDFTGTTGILGKDSGAGVTFNFDFVSTEKISFYIKTTTNIAISTTNTYTDKNWHHVVGVYDGSQMFLYVDGASAATPVVQTGSLNANGINFLIGDTVDSAYFPGFLDDVRIYNRALSATEVKKLYNLGR